MGDLVLLRDLIKSSARGQSVDLNVLFRHLNFDTLFECIIARAVSPCAAEAVARAFHFLGVRSAALCADVAPSPSSFARWYSRRMLAALRIDVAPQSPDPPTRKWEKCTHTQSHYQTTAPMRSRRSRATAYTTVIGCTRPTTGELARHETIAIRRNLHSKSTLCNGKGEVAENHVVFFDAILSR